jgi:hypothetical protein
MSRPRTWARSRWAWASARKVSQYSWVSFGAGGPGSDSSSRCQPSRHCTARSNLARSAHGGQMLARVAPHGIITCSAWPDRVGAPQLYGAQAAADRFGDLPDRVAGQRHRHPLCPGGPGRGLAHRAAPASIAGALTTPDSPGTPAAMTAGQERVGQAQAGAFQGLFPPRSLWMGRSGLPGNIPPGHPAGVEPGRPGMSCPGSSAAIADAIPSWRWHRVRRRQGARPLLPPAAGRAWGCLLPGRLRK